VRAKVVFLFLNIFSEIVYKRGEIDSVYNFQVMSTNTVLPSKEAKTVKSIFITDGRTCDGENFGICNYIYDFDMSMVPVRAWKALMVLEKKGEFHFPNVGDRGYKCLVDNVKDRRIQHTDFQEFFNLAMEDKHEWPRKEWTREENMKLLGNCSWLVNLVDEWD
jgi:hypothetical protein